MIVKKEKMSKDEVKNEVVGLDDSSDEEDKKKSGNMEKASTPKKNLKKVDEEGDEDEEEEREVSTPIITSIKNVDISEIKTKKSSNAVGVVDDSPTTKQVIMKIYA